MNRSPTFSVETAGLMNAMTEAMSGVSCVTDVTRARAQANDVTSGPRRGSSWVIGRRGVADVSIGCTDALLQSTPCHAPTSPTTLPTRSATCTTRPARSSSRTPTSRSSARSASRRPSTAPSARAAALIDLPQRGVLELTGKDRLPFLNNLLTNQTWDKATKSGLAAGHGRLRVLPERQGPDRRRHERAGAARRPDAAGDGRADGRAGPRDVRQVPVRRAGEDDRPGRRRCTRSRCMGPRAVEVLEQVTRPARGRAAAARVGRDARMFDVDVVVFRDDPAGVPGYALIVRRRRGRARSG